MAKLSQILPIDKSEKPTLIFYLLIYIQNACTTQKNPKVFQSQEFWFDYLFKEEKEWTELFIDQQTGTAQKYT